MSRHIITPVERGHRHPLSDTEKTVRYYIHVIYSVKQKLDALGKKRVRKLLNEIINKNV